MTHVEDRTQAAGMPTEAELLGRARDLGPLLKKNAAQTEADRRVAEENIRVIEDAGLFKIAVPRRYGGYEAPFRTFVQVSGELARACGSTAWAATLINVCAWLTGLYPQQAQDEVFGADAGARVAGVLAPTATSRKAEGGQVITGRWGFASGSLHASWVIVGIPVADETGAVVDQGLALVSREEVTIDDTWYVAGMRGTGSNTIVADQVFVPSHRILSVPPAVGGLYPTEHKDERLYHSALVPVLALVLNGPMVGLAQGAFDIVTQALAKGRGIAYTFYDKAALAPTVQLQMAEAAQLIDTARLHLLRAADDIDRCAQADDYMDFLTRARVRADVGTIARRSREAVDLLLNVHGASSFAEANPLQRIWRDLEVCTRHAVVGADISKELYGRALLGVEEQITALI